MKWRDPREDECWDALKCNAPARPIYNLIISEYDYKRDKRRMTDLCDQFDKFVLEIETEDHWEEEEE